MLCSSGSSVNLRRWSSQQSRQYILFDELLLLTFFFLCTCRIHGEMATKEPMLRVSCLPGLELKPREHMLRVRFHLQSFLFSNSLIVGIIPADTTQCLACAQAEEPGSRRQVMRMYRSDALCRGSPLACAIVFLLHPVQNCLNAAMLIECRKRTCPSGAHCVNRRIQEGSRLKLAKFAAEGRGFGLQTLDDVDEVCDS